MSGPKKGFIEKLFAEHHGAIHGQVLFQVAHDSSRRFRVVAGAAGAIAVRTEFDVYPKDRRHDIRAGKSPCVQESR
jgi:hypothetical protein